MPGLFYAIAFLFAKSKRVRVKKRKRKRKRTHVIDYDDTSVELQIVDEDDFIIWCQSIGTYFLLYHNPNQPFLTGANSVALRFK